MIFYCKTNSNFLRSEFRPFLISNYKKKMPINGINILSGILLKLRLLRLLIRRALNFEWFFLTSWICVRLWFSDEYTCNSWRFFEDFLKNLFFFLINQQNLQCFWSLSTISIGKASFCFILIGILVFICFLFTGLSFKRFWTIKRKELVLAWLVQIPSIKKKYLFDDSQLEPNFCSFRWPFT